MARTTQNLPSDIPSQQAARGAFRIFVAVLLGLVAVVTVLVILPIEVSALASAPPTTVGTPAISQYFEVLEAITFVGIALGAAQLYLLATGFGMLAGGDEEFRTPATMIWVGFVGVIVVSVAVLTEFGGGFALLGLLAIVVGAIFAGVGGIGVLIGFWRMGVTYEVGRMKLAVILLASRTLTPWAMRSCSEERTSFGRDWPESRPRLTFSNVGTRGTIDRLPRRFVLLRIGPVLVRK